MKKTILTPLLMSIFLIWSTCIKAQWNHIYDTVSFEHTDSNIILYPAENNSWQIGTPRKIIFDSAYSGTKAIVTDTLRSAPPNDTSSFIYILSNAFTYSCYTSMSFWHKYDMDSSSQKGIIEASYDGGSSWLLLKDTSFTGPLQSEFQWIWDYHLSSNQYMPHRLITTGKSDGWIQSLIVWQWYWPARADTIIIPPDSLMIKFTFISDSAVSNREGWMIDEIVTSCGNSWDCSSVTEHSSPGKLTVSPNPFTTSTTVTGSVVFHNACLTLYDSKGEIVFTEKGLSGKSFELKRNGLSPGIYFLTLTGKNNKRLSAKVFVGNR